MKKLLKTAIRIAGLLTIGGAIVGYKDHLDNKKEGRKPRTIYEDGVKRGIDWMCGMAALIVLWPLYLIVAVLVRINLGSPVIFTQERPGRDEKIFKLYKYRTMTDEKDDNGALLPDEKRLPAFGKFLRSTSLDELPEIFNIIKGDMSVIGPRPLLVEYLPFYTEKEKERHLVRPGLSGYAQVNGRNYVTWEEKFKMDIWYIKNVSLKTDVGIMLKTIGVALRRDNIETASQIIHDGVVYQPLNIERKGKDVR